MLHTIYLYDDPDVAGLDVDYLGAWLGTRLPDCQVKVVGDFLTQHLGKMEDVVRDEAVERLSNLLASLEIHNLVRPADRDILPEVLPEEHDLDLVYDALGLQAALRGLIREDEGSLGDLHIAFTAQFLGEWVAEASLLKLRAGVLGQPCLLSPSSLIEALELPKQYHFLRQQVAVLGVDEEAGDLTEQFQEQSLGYGDPRLNEVLKGYVLQAVFHRLIGETGCDDAFCRLGLATTHEDVLRRQTSCDAGLCARHAGLLRSFGGVPE